MEIYVTCGEAIGRLAQAHQLAEAANLTSRASSLCMICVGIDFSSRRICGPLLCRTLQTAEKLAWEK
jgi:hypothetical protein